MTILKLGDKKSAARCGIEVNSNWLVVVCVYVHNNTATSSNCGNLLKDKLLTMSRNTYHGARVMTYGYSKNVYYVTMDNPQPSSKGIHIHVYL